MKERTKRINHGRVHGKVQVFLRKSISYNIVNTKQFMRNLEVKCSNQFDKRLQLCEQSAFNVIRIQFEN